MDSYQASCAAESYEQNVEVNVLRCQKVLATFVKENVENSDPFDETTVVQLVKQRVQGMGCAQEQCDEQMMRLVTFMPGHDATNNNCSSSNRRLNSNKPPKQPMSRHPRHTDQSPRLCVHQHPPNPTTTQPRNFLHHRPLPDPPQLPPRR